MLSIVSQLAEARVAETVDVDNDIESLLETSYLSHSIKLTDTAVWTRIEMSRDFFVKASLTFFDQIILPVRNQMVGKV